MSKKRKASTKRLPVPAASAKLERGENTRSTMKLPAKYLAARRALAEAVRVDEVKDILDKSIAMEVYAYQAKDAELAGDAVEIKKRAERRIGEIMAETPKAKGARVAGTKRGATRVASGPASLADQGVDKHLADRARKAAAMSQEKFEANVEKARAMAVAAAEGDKAIITAARTERHTQKKKRRAEREQALANKLLALPTKKYAVILADPEWKFEVWSERGLMNTGADNHYPTSPLEEIKKRDVASIAADDAVLFLWATVPMMPHALEVMKAWGFNYVTHVAWIKDKAGTGYWFRNKHELLLVGTRGHIPAPAEGTQYPSAIEAAVEEHSAKPAIFYEMIEAYFPTVPKIELNLRGEPRPGWDGWGNEAEAEREKQVA